MADYAKLFRDRAEASKGQPHEERLDQMQTALAEYRNAQLLVPILKSDLERRGDPFQCQWATSVDFPWDYEEVTLKACDDGADPVKALLSLCNDFGILWRPMKREERMKPGELLALMTGGDRDKAVELFGVKLVAEMMIADDALRLMRP